MPLTIYMTDGTKLGGDQMSMELPKPIHTIEQHEAARLADQTKAIQEKVDYVADLQRQRNEMKQQERTVPVVWAELQHAQEQAARVKPLREELDRLLGRKVRARKAVQK